MSEGETSRYELFSAISYDSTNKGVFIFQTKRNRNMRSFSEKSHLLTLKHQLFHSHRSSFYGVQLQIKSCYVKAWDSDTFDLIEAIWIPLQFMHYLLEIDINTFQTKVSDSTHSFLSYLAKLHKSKCFFPTRHGQWQLDSSFLSELHKEKMLIATNTDELTSVGNAYNNEKLIYLLNDWLQINVLFYFMSKTEWTSFKNGISESTNDSQISQWLFALEKPDRTFTLSQHLYPIGVQKWSGEAPEPFQLHLIIYAPISKNHNWKLEWFIKEWESGSLVSLLKVMEGAHPFQINPISWLQKEKKRLSAATIPLTLHYSNLFVFYLSSERFTDYLMNDVKKLEENGISVLIPESLQRKITPRLSANLSLFEKDDFADEARSWVHSHVSWKLDLNELQMDEATFRYLVEQQKEMVHINDQWVLWDLEMARRFVHYVDQTKNDEHLSFFDGLRAALNSEESNMKIGIRDEMDGSLPITWSLTSDTEAALLKQETRSRSLTPKWIDSLREYQQNGTNWLLNMRNLQLGCCLADDMGLGKTIQTIAYIDEVISNETLSTPFLILCPSSLIHNWSNELNKFANNLTVYVHNGAPIKRHKQWHKWITKADVVICSYPTATKDLEKLTSIHWSGCILDEAQQLKNIRTKLRKAMKRLNASHMITLTGTPIENHPFEMWTMMDLLNPGLLKNETWFSENFLHSNGREDKTERLSHLREIVRPFLLRRTKTSFEKELSLPKKTVIDHHVSLTAEQQVLYEAVVEELLKSYDDEPLVVQRALLFKTMTKLKQICNHPAQLYKEQGKRTLQKGRSEKWDLSVRIMEDWLHSGKRGLVFTQYRFIGSLIQKMGKNNWDLSIPFFHGGLTSHQREEMIHNYQSHRSSPIMVISLRAGGFGINMTEASEMIHYDRWWNPAVEDQATDRIHRIGQTKPVQVHRITSKGTIEDRIADLLTEKKKLQKAVIDGRPLPIWTLSREELTDLFTLK
ncbi:DEAD/DEAH box helicase [Salipaludibacillus daqingensis]|uniref:DEAD/DEAH box helicase n=1 Tax=Salipaludibacillus daqingensis TaxID=3041001 RepID=UPI002475D95A|nr:DEAD/DEAH box helicase [Salipaludibacillus daqingensis]